MLSLDRQVSHRNVCKRRKKAVHFWHYKYQSLFHFILLNIKQIDYNIQQLPHVCFLQATPRMFKVLQCQNK